jgi:hypothetical protein
LENTQSLPLVALKAWSLFQGIDYVFLNAGMAVRDMIINTEMEMVEKS